MTSAPGSRDIRAANPAFRDRLRAAAEAAQIALDLGEIIQLEQYFALLARWNPTINLTSLALDPLSDATISRLLIEPLQVACRIENAPLRWFDLGSGGGSPAIPLKIVRPLPTLTMVESRSRKAAFLSEVARFLDLTDVIVLLTRIEAIENSESRDALDLVTMQAVRTDERLLRVVSALLVKGGRLCLFGASSGRAYRVGLEQVDRIQFVGGGSSAEIFRKT